MTKRSAKCVRSIPILTNQRQDHPLRQVGMSIGSEAPCRTGMRHVSCQESFPATAKQHISFPIARATMYGTSCTYFPHLQSHRWQHIEAFSTHRRQDTNVDDDIIQNIDDVRNGPFITSILHRVLGSRSRNLEGASVQSDAAHDQKLTVSLSRHRTLRWSQLMSVHTIEAEHERDSPAMSSP